VVLVVVVALVQAVVAQVVLELQPVYQLQLKHILLQ
jgi:hypothetical protein